MLLKEEEEEKVGEGRKKNKSEENAIVSINQF